MQLPVNYTTLLQDLNKTPSAILSPVSSTPIPRSAGAITTTATTPSSTTAALSPVTPPRSSAASFLSGGSPAVKPALFAAPTLLNKENHPDIQVILIFTFSHYPIFFILIPITVTPRFQNIWMTLFSGEYTDVKAAPE